MAAGKMNLKSDAKSKKAIWISYDLGLRGDYAGLYAWLDTHGARECGDSTAYVLVETLGNDISDWLKKELESHMKLLPKDRIYIIYQDKLKMKGKFVNGGRKRAPWEGYGQQEVENAEDVA